MLEKRLATIADMVEPNSRLADIGTDHAYLPIDLVQNGKIDFAIASDVAKGPLDNAKNDILAAGLNDKIQTRLGSGLDTISSNDQIDTVVIAGMGGKLMVDLLEKARKEGKVFQTLILEPNVGEDIVRSWLSQNNYMIKTEVIIEVSGHIYEIIKAELTSNNRPLTLEEIKFGPFLIREKNSIFIKKWEKQLTFQKQLLKNLNKAKVPDTKKIDDVNNTIKMIKEVLK
ncbi:class I SAM-dependent methyltransferase [uncultured Lactobacillus sp.]|uniref:tRNA (adenine(22)-N(1))-methyltransferase n=1 Tax=uncultured Lactobacillus sp. TaxID=153152 RepID=UPI00262AB5A3|nr:class I SAM-dependent methyltransferase [uncultured Lactobacillus sp.]